MKKIYQTPKCIIEATVLLTPCSGSVTGSYDNSSINGEDEESLVKDNAWDWDDYE